MVALGVITAVALFWASHALALSWIMRRRGFHPLPWFAVSSLLGPAIWPLAVIEAWAGLPSSEILRQGSPHRGDVDVFVVLERDELPDALTENLRRALKDRRRLTLGRVLRAGGPTAEKLDAACFLTRLADRLRTDDAEIIIYYGNMEDAMSAIDGDDGSTLVLRGDRPAELAGKAALRFIRCGRQDADARTGRSAPDTPYGNAVPMAVERGRKHGARLLRTAHR